MKKIHFFVLVLFSFKSAFLCAEAKTVSLFLANQIYANNLEYVGAVDRFREGETFFGNLLKTGTSLEFMPHQYFNAGVFLRIPFGSEKLVDPFFPIISLHSHFLDQRLEFIAGSLNVHHQTDEFISDNNLFYVRPVEFGLQTISRFSFFESELWINWQRQENEMHNEKFDTGIVAKVKSHGFFGKVQGHCTHIGGQLYKNADPVQDDVVIAMGGGYAHPIPWINTLELSVHRLFSIFRIRARELKEGEGYQTTFLISPKDWNLSWTSWWGNNFYHEDGDPLYKASRYSQFGISKIFQFSKDWNIRFDARLKIVNGNMVHSEGILFSWNMMQPLFKF